MLSVFITKQFATDLQIEKYLEPRITTAEKNKLRNVEAILERMKKTKSSNAILKDSPKSGAYAMMSIKMNYMKNSTFVNDHMSLIMVNSDQQ